MTSHTDTVQQVKDALVAKGVTLSGPDGAFEITKRVAWALRGEGAGLLSKPAGNNSHGYAVDIVAYPGGQIVDILEDSGGKNGAAWNVGTPVDASRYRAAIDPGDVVTPPASVPAPLPDCLALLNRLDILEIRVNAKLEAIWAAANAHPNYRAPINFSHSLLGTFRGEIVLKADEAAK